MLFFEDWVDRVINIEGQIIKDLSDLTFNKDELYNHVFRSGLEQMHRSRPVIITTNVVGPRWMKTPDCQSVVRVTSNFLLTNQASAAAIYTGREVRQNFEENDLAVWVPMGLSTLRYFRKFRFNFSKRIEKYPLSHYDIYPNVPYDFVLPFETVGDVEISSKGKDITDFVVVRDKESSKKVTVTYVPRDGSKEPITAIIDPISKNAAHSAYEFLNSAISENIQSTFSNEPTLYLTGFCKYEYFNTDQWNNESELIEWIMRSKFLRMIAHSKSVFTVSEVEFDPNKDLLIQRASELEAKCEELLAKNNQWWEF